MMNDQTSSIYKVSVAVGIATAGRRETLAAMLRQLALQQSPPSRLLICPAAADDLDRSALDELPFRYQVVRSEQIGSCAQRNAILDACDADVVVFMDDDFYPATDYVGAVADVFGFKHDVVVATNHPVVDGATGPGISHDEALKILDALRPTEPGAPWVTTTYGGYGCNMAVRLAAVRRHQIRFDERLPLYGWLEDIDFSRRLAPHGRIVKVSTLRGVHLATKRGRTAGVRLGYSQVVNPLYMVRKGSMDMGYALPQILRNVAKNLVRSFRAEPWVDRRGRLKGNLLALGDVLRNRLDPGRIRTL